MRQLFRCGLTISSRWFSNGATSVRDYITRNLIFLAYWTYFESTSGQSIGKKLVIKTVRISGEALKIPDALIESFGKDAVTEYSRIFNQTLESVTKLQATPRRCGISSTMPNNNSS